MTKPYKTRAATVGTKGSTGFCVNCGAIATTEALFKVEGATVIQRYCDDCVRKATY